MKSVRRTFSLRGRITSVAVEVPFWDVLDRVANENGLTMGELVDRIDQTWPSAATNRCSALRLYALAEESKGKVAR